MDSSVQVQAVGHVSVVTLDRPPNNFVDPDLLTRLADALEAADADETCRAVLLKTAGKVFCAGADLKGAANSRAPEPPDGVNPLYAQAVRLYATRKPIVVAVQGAAVGAGLGLALIGDFRVAAQEARFAANFVKLGFHPGFGISDTLPRVVGAQAASLMLLTGRRLDAETASRIGLVDQVTTAERLYDDALALAAEIAENAPLAVQATRATLRAGLAEQVRQRTTGEWAEQRRLLATEDFAEGVRAVAERRPGAFVGR